VAGIGSVPPAIAVVSNTALPLAVIGIAQIPLAISRGDATATPAPVLTVGIVLPPGDVGQLRGAWPQTNGGGWGSSSGAEWPQTHDEEWELVP
jgi:hypothetical protein